MGQPEDAGCRLGIAGKGNGERDMNEKAMERIRFRDKLRKLGLADNNMHWEEKTKLICHWLAERVRFGTLDVSVQRMAIPSPD